MGNKLLIAAALWMGLSHAALADERIWNWILISPTNPGAKSAWFTDHGTAKDSSMGRSFDIHIGGNATAADPDHLSVYGLKGTIRGNSVTATLYGVDADVLPEQYSGKLVTKAGTDRIMLVDAFGGVILLYAPTTKSK